MIFSLGCPPLYSRDHRHIMDEKEKNKCTPVKLGMICGICNKSWDKQEDNMNICSCFKVFFSILLMDLQKTI